MNLNLILYGTKESPQKRDLRSDDEGVAAQFAAKNNLNLKAQPPQTTQTAPVNQRNRKPNKQSSSQQTAHLAKINKNNKSEKINPYQYHSASNFGIGNFSLGENLDSDSPNLINQQRPSFSSNDYKPKPMKLFKSSSKQPTTTTTTSSYQLMKEAESDTSVNNDYYATNENEPDEETEPDDAEANADGNNSNQPKSHSNFVDINNSNENYVDYYNDVNANGFSLSGGVANSIDQENEQPDYDSSVSSQHSSMLRNGIQISHERSSSGYISSTTSKLHSYNYFFKSFVTFFILLLNYFVKTF